MVVRIYKLVDPKKKIPIYVGSTKRTLPERLKEHMYSRSRGNAPIYDYLFNNKVTPTIELLEEMEVESSKEVIPHEVKWIDKLTAKGIKLFNKNRTNKFTGSIRVDWGIFERVKDFCDQEGMSIGRFYDIAAKERLTKFGVLE